MKESEKYPCIIYQNYPIIHPAIIRPSESLDFAGLLILSSLTIPIGAPNTKMFSRLLMSVNYPNPTSRSADIDKRRKPASPIGFTSDSCASPSPRRCGIGPDRNP
jgi:hypothetical protein